MGKNYYPQVFLEECKCIVKGTLMARHIAEDLYFFYDSDDSDAE